MLEQGEDHAVQWYAYNDRLDMMVKLLENSANVHANDDSALRWSAGYGYLNIVKKLLEHGANIYCDNKIILKQLHTKFDERTADAILPYCGANNYKYFPEDYIRARTTHRTNQKCWHYIKN